MSRVHKAAKDWVPHRHADECRQYNLTDRIHLGRFHNLFWKKIIKCKNDDYKTHLENSFDEYGFNDSEPNNSTVAPITENHHTPIDSSQNKVYLEYFETYLVSEGNAAHYRGYPSLAKYYYGLAASHGSSAALYNLGLMYLHGQGIMRNEKRAMKCFIVCASNCMSKAMCQLGYMYFCGRGVTRNYEKARLWFMCSIKTNENAFARYNLSIIYLLGLGAQMDKFRGRKYLLECARANFSPALYNLAVCCSSGKHGFKRDLQAAIQLYTYLASDTNIYGLYAQNNLGVLLMDRSPTHAINLFMIASQNGLSEAAYNLGEICKTGIRVPRDFVLATQYFQCATELAPNYEAEYMLGVMYMHGNGADIDPDLSLSSFWFMKAADHGNHTALKHSISLRKKLRQTSALTPADDRLHN